MRHRNNRGFAIALTLFLIVILATVCFGALNVTTLDSRTATEDYKASRSFYAARAGVAFAKRELTDASRVSTTSAVSYGKQHLKLADGTDADEAFSVIITPAVDNSSRVFRIWKVESTGYYDDASRCILAYLELESFAKYGYFTDIESTSSQTIQFAPHDSLTGAVHTNGYFTISGHPSFQGQMTSANSSDDRYNSTSGTYKRTDGQTVTDNKDYYRSANNNYIADRATALNDSPDFSFAGGQEVIELPKSTNEDAINAANNEGSTLSGNYKIVFTEDGQAKCYKITTTTQRVYSGRSYTTKTVTTYEGYPTKSGDVDRPAKVIDTTRSPGCTIYVDGNIEVSGDVQGRVTLANSGNCYITDDIQYVDDNACVLGIMSNNNVIVRTDKNTKQDIYIDAIIMALKGSFTVENYSSGINRGYLHLFGGLVQYKRGAVGTSSTSKTPIYGTDSYGRKIIIGYETEGTGTATGYTKDYVYDKKLEIMPPLNFPNTGKYRLRYFLDKGSLGGV